MFDTNEYGEVMPDKVKATSSIQPTLSSLGKCTRICDTWWIVTMAQIRWFDMWEPKRRYKHSLLPDGISITYTWNNRIHSLVNLFAWQQIMHIYALRSRMDAQWTYIAKKDSGLAKYQCTRESVNVYCCGIYNGMQEFTSLEEVTQGLSISMHKPGSNAFPHTNLVMHPNLVKHTK